MQGEAAIHLVQRAVFSKINDRSDGQRQLLIILHLSPSLRPDRDAFQEPFRPYYARLDLLPAL
jgi:hypothetical protein